MTHSDRPLAKACINNSHEQGYWLPDVGDFDPNVTVCIYVCMYMCVCEYVCINIKNGTSYNSQFSFIWRKKCN